MLIDETKELAAQLYEAYGQDADWKTYDGRPMPQWGDLGEAVQSHWRAVATWHQKTSAPYLDGREILQITHAKLYAVSFSNAGVPGHGQFILIAKLSRALGL